MMILSFLIPFLLAMTSTSQGPAPTAAAATAAPVKCVCQDIGHKEW